MTSARRDWVPAELLSREIKTKKHIFYEKTSTYGTRTAIDSAGTSADNGCC